MSATFKQFCKIHEKYVYTKNVEDEEELLTDLHDLYVQYKEGIKHYYQSATEFILTRYEECTFERNTYLLKRNLPKHLKHLLQCVD